MSRSAFLIDLALVIGLGLLLLALSNLSATPLSPAGVQSAASSTLAIIPTITLPDVSLPSLPATTVADAPAEALPPPAKTQSAPAVAAAPKTVPLVAATTPEVVPATPLESAAVTLRKALVNILCIAPPSSGIRSISGSGVIVDPKGIILTNAHIAQFFLLEKNSVSCTIRSGSPATARYKASLIYIPTAWVKENAGILNEEAPVGTGERDYGLLAVTRSATEESLPSSFSYIPLAAKAPATSTPVAIASYGSQSLVYDQIRSTLYPTIVFSSVKDVYTFARTTVDVIELGGSAAAQQGSSGGGVADVSGTLIGTITTSTTEGETSARILAAITASYIRADYANATGEPLNLLLAKPTAVSVADFAPNISALRSLITAQLP